MKAPPLNATLPPATDVSMTAAALIDTFHRERTKPFEALSADALAGRLILNEGSPFYAALRVSETEEGHYLRRALTALRAADNKSTASEHLPLATASSSPMECPA